MKPPQVCKYRTGQIHSRTLLCVKRGRSWCSFLYFCLYWEKSTTKEQYYYNLHIFSVCNPPHIVEKLWCRYRAYMATVDISSTFDSPIFYEPNIIKFRVIYKQTGYLLYISKPVTLITIIVGVIGSTIVTTSTNRRFVTTWNRINKGINEIPQRFQQIGSWWHDCPPRSRRGSIIVNRLSSLLRYSFFFPRLIAREGSPQATSGRFDRSWLLHSIKFLRCASFHDNIQLRVSIVWWDSIATNRQSSPSLRDHIYLRLKRYFMATWDSLLICFRRRCLCTWFLGVFRIQLPQYKSPLLLSLGSLPIIYILQLKSSRPLWPGRWRSEGGGGVFCSAHEIDKFLNKRGCRPRRWTNNNSWC